MKLLGYAASIRTVFQRLLLNSRDWLPGEIGGIAERLWSRLMVLFPATHSGYLGLGTEGESRWGAAVEAKGFLPTNLPPRSSQASNPHQPLKAPLGLAGGLLIGSPLPCSKHRSPLVAAVLVLKL